MPGQGPDCKLVEVGDAILDYLALADAALGLVDRSWFDNVKDPSNWYPPNPYIDCPAVKLRGYTADLEPGNVQAGQVHSDEYRYSIWYYRRQTPGQAHQELILADLQTLRNYFTQDGLDPTRFPGVAGVRYKRIFPTQLVLYTQQEHEFEDPNLIVSTGELVVIARVYITTC